MSNRQGPHGSYPVNPFTWRLTREPCRTCVGGLRISRPPGVIPSHATCQLRAGKSHPSPSDSRVMT